MPHRETKAALVDTVWIVLTPSVDHEAWLKALSKTAASIGREMIVATTPLDVADGLGQPGLFVTCDAGLISGIDPSTVAVIMPQPETAAEMTAALYDTQPPQSLFHASLLLARAVSLDDGVRLITAEQLARNPETVELMPGVVVHPPIAERGKPQPAVAVALGLYRQGKPRPGTTVTWSEQIFAYDPRSCIEGSPLGVLDISGRPRTLLYGPYLALPAGRWKSTMRFSIDQDGATHELRFDWGLDTDFVSKSVTPGHSGIYEIEIEHTVAELGLWQFRILVMQGVFEGHMTFLGGVVTLLDDAA